MSGKNDLTGREFGDLRCVEATDAVDAKKSIVWNCKCKCGQTVLRGRNALLYMKEYECQHQLGKVKLRGEGFVDRAERRRGDRKE